MRKYLQWAISIAVSAIAFWLAFRGVQVAEVADTLRTANYFYVLPALACIVVGLMARALSWQTILGRKVPFWRAFTALNEGYLLSNVLPFRLGELGRAYLVSRNRGLSTSQAFSSVIVERMIDLCMIVVLFATVLPLVAGLAWAREAAVLAVVISLAGMGGLIAYMVNPPSMAWASVPLPDWLRWAGVGIGLIGGSMLTWTLRSLGKNLTDTVVTRRAHALVRTGPYRWVRHPFYSSIALVFLANSLAAANWFLFLAGSLALTLLVIRTRREEANLIARFGQEYVEYMKRTGRFVPRFGRRT